VALTRWFWYAVTAVNLVSGKIKVLKFSVRAVSVSSDLGGMYSTWNRGWYRCIELRMICNTPKCQSNCQCRNLMLGHDSTMSFNLLCMKLK
jgi:hypothetical protein